MGSIKKQASLPEAQEHELSEQEFNYIFNINEAKAKITAEYNRVISAFIKYVTVERLGYQPEEDLQFELDFADKKRTLKVTKIPKEN